LYSFEPAKISRAVAKVKFPFGILNSSAINPFTADLSKSVEGAVNEKRRPLSSLSSSPSLYIKAIG
jgi:hypothetical protein